VGKTSLAASLCAWSSNKWQTQRVELLPSRDIFWHHSRRKMSQQLVARIRKKLGDIFLMMFGLVVSLLCQTLQ
jgi:hypothetical protein